MADVVLTTSYQKVQENTKSFKTEGISQTARVRLEAKYSSINSANKTAVIYVRIRIKSDKDKYSWWRNTNLKQTITVDGNSDSINRKTSDDFTTSYTTTYERSVTVTYGNDGKWLDKTVSCTSQIYEEGGTYISISTSGTVSLPTPTTAVTPSTTISSYSNWSTTGFRVNYSVSNTGAATNVTLTCGGFSKTVSIGAGVTSAQYIDVTGQSANSTCSVKITAANATYTSLTNTISGTAYTNGQCGTVSPSITQGSTPGTLNISFTKAGTWYVTSGPTLASSSIKDASGTAYTTTVGNRTYTKATVTVSGTYNYNGKTGQSYSISSGEQTISVTTKPYTTAWYNTAASLASSSAVSGSANLINATYTISLATTRNTNDNEKVTISYKLTGGGNTYSGTAFTSADTSAKTFTINNIATTAAGVSYTLTATVTYSTGRTTQTITLTKTLTTTASFNIAISNLKLAINQPRVDGEKKKVTVTFTLRNSLSFAANKTINYTVNNVSYSEVFKDIADHNITKTLEAPNYNSTFTVTVAVPAVAADGLNASSASSNIKIGYMNPVITANSGRITNIYPFGAQATITFQTGTNYLTSPVPKIEVVSPSNIYLSQNGTTLTFGVLTDGTLDATEQTRALKPETEYTMIIRATDNEGNVSNQNYTLPVFTTLADKWLWVLYNDKVGRAKVYISLNGADYKELKKGAVKVLK